MEFKSKKQANECLSEWKQRLFLNDWTIKLLIVKPKYIEGFQGTCEFDYSISSAVIRITKSNKDLKKRIVKYCAEETLVHELLHCKYNLIKQDNSYEGILTDMHEHQLIEQMAKSLIMAKYGLTFDWFAS